MGAFAGWEMPISYAGTIAEHTAVRERAGLFDVSHLGKVLVSGPDAAVYLDTQLTNRMADLAVGRARYSLICNEDGGILDDLIVYTIGEEEMLVVPNAANRDLVFERLATAAPASIDVRIMEWTTFAIQGPRSRDVVESLYPSVKGEGYMRVAREGDVIISRSGYTGEIGYEIFTREQGAIETWDRLLSAVRDAGGEPAGLAARDTLRLEMGYPLHGSDIDAQTTPAEADLMWAVRLQGREFPGAQAIATRPPERMLVGLRMTDKLIPRHGYEVRREGRSIGNVTSGTFSPTLRIGIALAYVEPGSATLGDPVEVDVRGKAGRAQVVQPPFVDRSPKA
jgi:glycine cleavage system T protein (aminomethyltransferase)